MKHMKSIVTVILMAMSVLSYAQSDTTKTKAPAPESPAYDTVHLRLKQWAVDEINAINKQIEEVNKELTKEQRIQMLVTLREEKIKDIIKERGKIKLEDLLNGSELRGNLIILAVKKPAPSKAPQEKKDTKKSN